MQIKEAGDSALLLELEATIDEAVNARAIAIAAAVRAESIAGVRDVVSTYRAVAVHFDPLIADADRLRGEVERAAGATPLTDEGREVEIPVAYGGVHGPDLDAVAAFAHTTQQDVIDRHAGREYRVFMLGFLPGFGYLGSVDPTIAAPRRSSPRAHVPSGAVGIAGAQTGVYPCDSPGGWQLIGRTAARLFEPDRRPAALLSPGDRVRFRPAPQGGWLDTALVRPGALTTAAARSISVVDPGLMTTVQDRGRWGHQWSGVPVGGAMDWIAHRTANALVGNDADAATLEATMAGPVLRFEQRTTIAVAGGDLGATLDGARVPHCATVECAAGGVLRFSGRAAGARAYIAADGGFDVPRVLGSRATHVVSRLGGSGRALLPGDRIGLGAARAAAVRARRPARDAAAYIGTGGARLRVVSGPQDEFFPPDALEVLQSNRFRVSPQSNRMGYRLQGPAIPRRPELEMISDAAFIGAIQVPGSGDPILLMADRQTTGGYPQLAVVITADLPVAAQLAPGDWVEFEVCSRADALSALVAQEARLLAFE